MLDIDISLICYDILLVYVAAVKIFTMLLFGCLGITVMITILLRITELIKYLVKEHQNRSDDCENGTSESRGQSLTGKDEYHIIQEDKESFDKNTRTDIGEESGMSSVDTNEKGHSGECYGVTKDDGQHSNKENKESFDEDGRKSLGKGSDMIFIDLNDKSYLEGH